MEIDAIDAVQAGNRQLAMEIINSAKYRELKAEYMTALLGYIAQIEERALFRQKAFQNEQSISLTPEEKDWIATIKS